VHHSISSKTDPPQLAFTAVRNWILSSLIALTRYLNKRKESVVAGEATHESRTAFRWRELHECDSIETERMNERKCNDFRVRSKTDLEPA